MGRLSQAIGPSKPFRFALIMGLLHSALLALSFAQIPLWPLVFVCVLPLFLVVATTERSWRSALGVWLGAAPVWILFHRWLVDVTALGFPGLVAYLSLWSALFVLLGCRIRTLRIGGRSVPLWVTLPILWTGLEYLRGEIVFDGYPWYLLGQALVGGPDLEHPGFFSYPAAFVSAYGLTLGAALLLAPLLPQLRAVRTRKAEIIAGVTPVVIAVAWLGAASLAARGVPADSAGDASSEPSLVRVGIVQTNVPQDNKIGWSPEQQIQDFDRFEELTRDVAAMSPPPDLIVWPETMFPGLTLDPDAAETERAAQLVYSSIGERSTIFVDRLLALQMELGIPLLVGAVGYEGFAADLDSEEIISFDEKFNSVFLLDEGAVVSRYDKIHLTPFGEVMPYISRFDWLEKSLLAIGAGGMRFDLSRGETPVAFDIGGARIVTPICFEATMQGVVADLANGANIIVHVTNDGWFGSASRGREMHATIARLRAIEMGIPLVRVANTGISLAFGPDGRRIDLRGGDGAEPTPLLPAMADGVAIADIWVSDGAHRIRPVFWFLGPASMWVTIAVAVWAVTGFARRRLGKRIARNEG